MAQPTLLVSGMDEGPPKSLAQLSQETRETYRQLLLAFNHEASSGEQITTERALAEFGRLNVWIEQTGAALRNRGSLEDVLQTDTGLRDDIAGVLQQLKTQLSLAKSLASRPKSELLAPIEDDASDLTSDSEYSTDSQQAEGMRSQRQRIPKLSLAMLHAFESIGLLYHYSAIFRRPRLGGRYLHSKSKDTAPDIPYYEYSHVQQKLEEWYQRKDRPQSDFVSDGLTAQETLTTDSVESQQASTADLDFLCMRLAAANARRRDQLRYWGNHPFIGDQKLFKEEVSADFSRTEIESSVGVSESRSHRSDPTVNTFSSVARSAIYEDDGAPGPARTTYTSSVIGGGKLLKRIPNVPPQSREAPSFECPFCHMTLDSGPMQDRNTWKRHVFRDLRPYTCTFARCNNPDKLYATRREWIYHEMQLHRRQWNCRLCSTPFGTDTEMISHLESIHAGVWDRSQLPVLLEVSEGPVEESSDQQCVFCHETFSTKRLMEHVAGHLEDLALFVLPNDLTSDLAAEESSGILSSLNSADDDKSIVEPDDTNEVDAEGPRSGTVNPIEPVGYSNALGRDYSVSHPEQTWEPISPELTSVQPSNSPIDHLPPTSPVSPGQAKPSAIFLCEDCGRAFDQVHKLNHHKRYHARNYECPYPGCGKRFGTKTHLERHLNDKHLKQTRYYCTVRGCEYYKGGGKSFPRKDNWRRHMINKHGITPDDIPAEVVDKPPS